MSQFRSQQNRPRSFATSRMSSPMQIGIKQGIHTIKRGMAGVEYVRPSWQGTESVFRILPGLAPDGSGTLDSCRVSEEEGRYGTWQCCFEAVRNFGDPGVTMLLSNGDQGYDPYNQNPCWILYRALKDAVDRKQANPEWYPLVLRDSTSQRGAVLSKPSEVCLLQCLVFRHKNKNTFGPGRPPYGFAIEDPTIVLELSSSAARALFMELERRKEDYDGDPSSVDAFIWGDITSLDSGAFVHFFPLGSDPRDSVRSATAQTQDVYSSRPGPGSFMNRGNKQDIGFGCFLTDTLDGNTSPPDIKASLKGHEKKILPKIKPWGDILEFYPDKVQAHILNKCFPATAIVYAFQDHPEWVLPETKQLAVKAKRKSVPDDPPTDDYKEEAEQVSDPYGPPDEPEAPVAKPARAPRAADYTPASREVPDYSVPGGDLPEEVSEGTVLDDVSEEMVDIRDIKTPTPAKPSGGRPDISAVQREMEQARIRAGIRTQTERGNQPGKK